MVVMTFDEYDEASARFERAKVPTYYPTPTQFEIMENNPEKFVLYASYMLEFGKEPKNGEERYSKENLKNFVYKYLILTDTKKERDELRKKIANGEYQTSPA